MTVAELIAALSAIEDQGRIVWVCDGGISCGSPDVRPVSSIDSGSSDGVYLG